MKSLILITLNLLTLTLFGQNTSIRTDFSPNKLLVEYQTTPLGIDIEKPQFCWQMWAPKNSRGNFQTAYQIIVTDENNEKVWDTDKVTSGQSIGIFYEGAPLKPTTRYTWEVTVWNQDDNTATESSWFETGLMNSNPDLSAWDGATWIGGGDEDVVLQSHYFSVFKVQYQMQLDQASSSTKAAFVLGGNDQRLMEPNRNLFKLAVGKDESYVSIELDVAGLQNGEPAKLNLYRVGYTPDDQADTPLHSLDIPTEIINQNNQFDPHQFYVESVFGLFDVFVDGTDEAHKITKKEGGGFWNRGYNMNPNGRGGDFICFPMLADIGFQVDQEQKASFSDLQIRHFRQPSNIVFQESPDKEQSIFSSKDGLVITKGAYQVDGGTDGTLVLADPSQNAAPMLRTSFSTQQKGIKKARIYASARGIYELYLNGRRIGDDYFNPGLTQYNKHHMYQTYDVTNLINNGEENVLGAWLSEGWWSGNITFNGVNWNFFGDRQSLLAKLEITYNNGTKEVIKTAPNSWKLFTDGPVRYGSFFQGEIYDANKETAIENWSKPRYDDSAWKPAVEVPLEGNSVVGTFRNFAGLPVPLNYEKQKIIGQIGENVSVVKTMTAKSVEEVRPGVFVYDMTQNMVGVPNILIENGAPGDTIRLRYAEVRYPDLDEYGDHVGMVMMENIRAALTQDIYIMNSERARIQPRFTFHGFRYIEITGIEEALPLDAVTVKVLSSLPKLASHYETSNPLVNRLWQNITWSLRGNFLSIPTDTPARNERMGWNGDINVFSRASTWLAPVNPFLKRHLMAMRDMQAENGRFSDVAPVGNGFGGILWGSAGIVIPWELYQQFGDKQILTEHYDAMKAYVEFLETRQNEDGIIVEGPLGDWLSPENGKNDNTLLWTAYQVYDLQIMQKVATILGKEKDAKLFQEKYDNRKAFFNELYVNADNHKTIKSGIELQGFGGSSGGPEEKGKEMDTQASYAIPLAFNVFDEEAKTDAIEHLVNAITRKNTDDQGIERPAYSLMTGFIGTASMGQALSENGKPDVAYKLLQTETYPSWLYPVINGATTIWERLNSYTIEDGFGGNNSMNSFNHYAFGAIASWMYSYSLGIQRDEQNPGFKHFFLKPTPDPTGKMTWARGHYDSMYGRIESGWFIEKDQWTYSATVPPNTKATLTIEASTINDILAGRDQNGVALIRQEQASQDNPSQFIFELQPGNYEFVIKKN